MPRVTAPRIPFVEPRMRGVPPSSLHPIRRARERGAAFVMIAISIAVLVGLLGMAADLYIVTSSLQQARGQARLLALAAVKEYNNESLASLAPRQRLDAVLERVNGIAQQNRLIGAPAPARQLSLFDSADSNNAKAPRLIPGRYFRLGPSAAECADPKNHLQCVCTTDSTKAPNDPAYQVCNPCGEGREIPCFVPSSIELFTPVSSPPVTAFKVDAELYDALTLKFLRPLIQSFIVPVNVSAIATNVQRHMVVAVDLSASIMRQNYLYRPVSAQESTPELGRGSFYAFPVTGLQNQLAPGCFDGSAGPPPAPGQPCGEPFAPLINPTIGVPPQPIEPYSILDHWRFLRSFDHSTNTYSALGTPRGLAPVSIINSPVAHFYDSYGLLRTVGGRSSADLALDAAALGIHPELHVKPLNCVAAGGSAGGGRYCDSEQWLITDLCEDSMNCPGPQPFNAILQGIEYALQYLSERRVSGDRLGLLFFDRSLPWTRSVPLTNNFEYVRSLVGQNGEARKRRRALGILPGIGGFTDLNLALAESAQQFAAERAKEPGQESKDEIVLVTDGVANCLSGTGMVSSKGVPYELLDYNQDGDVTLDDLGDWLSANCFRDMGVGVSACSSPEACPRCFPGSVDDWYATHAEWLHQTNEIAGTGRLGCANSWDNYQGAISGVRKLVGGTLHDSGITLNVLAAGTTVGPNVKDIVRDGRCISDREARAQGTSFVTAGCYGPDPLICQQAFDGASAANPFVTAVEELYNLARATGGEYAPLFLDGAPFCKTTPTICAGNPNSPTCCESGKVWFNDKLCRSSEDQVRQFFRTIFERQPPYTIIESN